MNKKFLRLLNNNKIYYLILIMFVIIFTSSCVFIPKEEDVLAPPLKEPPKITYEYIELKRGTIEEKVQCKGYFISVEQKDLSFKNQSGRLKGIYVKIGDKVKKGDLLAELINENLENQLKQSELVLKKSLLDLDTLKLNNQKDIKLLKNHIAELKKKLEMMQLISDAYSYEDINIIKVQIEEQETIYNTTVATYKNNIKAAEGGSEIYRLQFENLKQNLDNARLIATIDGTVDYITDAKDGEAVDAFKTIVRVANPEDLQIQYSDEKVNEFDLGSKVTINYNSNMLSGEVVANPSNMPQDADVKVRNSIRIKIDKVPEEAKIGDPVDITLVKDRKENTFVIPGNYLQKAGERRYLNILENDIRKERDVEIGIQTATEVEIVKGVSEGEKVIKD